MRLVHIGYAFAGGVLGASALTGDVVGAVAGILVIGSLFAISFARSSPAPQFTNLERVEIASEDAYDHADALPDGRTVVEDKRTAQCYEAAYGGDRRVA